MKLFTKTIFWAGYDFMLTNLRAVYWQAENALLLSDLHIGKGAHFRKHGIALPIQVYEQDLERLKFLITHFGAQRLIIVGDMLHAQSNAEVQDFSGFLKSILPVETVLIKGNHDKLSDEQCLSLGLHAVHTEFNYQGILFKHEWSGESSVPQISGHLHPGYEISLPTRKSLRLPAYVIHPSYFILPAFSAFTGLDTKSAFLDAQYFPFHADGFLNI